MPEARREGVRIVYEEAGSGGPPLVFVHGWACDRSHFQPQFDHFARAHRVLALDQRGFGESDKPEQDYTVEGFAADVHWLCGELGVERPVIVGHSMGGAIALAVAARFPELPSGIVLCDPAVTFREALGANLANVVAALATDDYVASARGLIEGSMFVDGDDPERKRRITEGMLGTPQRIMHSAFAAIAAFDSEAAAKACRVPTLLIDAELPICDFERLRGACPQAVRAQTVGAGHFHQLEVPEQVNAMIETFLARKVAADA